MEINGNKQLKIRKYIFRFQTFCSMHWKMVQYSKSNKKYWYDPLRWRVNTTFCKNKSSISTFNCIKVIKELKFLHLDVSFTHHVFVCSKNIVSKTVRFTWKLDERHSEVGFRRVMGHELFVSSTTCSSLSLYVSVQHWLCLLSAACNQLHLLSLWRELDWVAECAPSLFQHVQAKH